MSGTTTIKLQSSDHAEIIVGKLIAPDLTVALAIFKVGLSYSTTTDTDTTVTEREVVERSVLIKHMMEDLGDQPITDAIPIPNVHPLLAPLRRGPRLIRKSGQ
jgi:hypothetical protein